MRLVLMLCFLILFYLLFRKHTISFWFEQLEKQCISCDRIRRSQWPNYIIRHTRNHTSHCKVLVNCSTEKYEMFKCLYIMLVCMCWHGISIVCVIKKNYIKQWLNYFFEIWITQCHNFQRPQVFTTNCHIQLAFSKIFKYKYMYMTYLLEKLSSIDKFYK